MEKEMSDHDQSGTSETSHAAKAEAALTDDQKALRLWFNALCLQDPRYDNKFILKLAAEAMNSEEYRTRLVHHTKELLSSLHYSPPSAETAELKFHDNTKEALHIVLPSRPQNRSPELRELLHSRTSIATLDSRDDWDFGDLGQGNSDSGNAGGLDGHPAKTV
jgi:hypothetical protein